MTSVQIIGPKKPDHRRKKISWCCCCGGAKKSASNVSVEADFNEPYEYVVEKLIIKRVPVKRFSAPSDLKRVETGPPSKDVLKDNQPIVTFSSYCQVGPTVVNKKHLPLTLMDDLIVEGDEVQDVASPKVLSRDDEEVNRQASFVLNEIRNDGGDQADPRFDSPREDMTSGRREQLQQCVKKLNTAQVYKHKTSPKASPRRKAAEANNVLFTKPMTARDKGCKDLPAAVKETMDILAKQPMSNANRRLVTRDPDTGQIKEIFQNIKLAKPMRLEEIYPQKFEGNSAEKERPKWKIIIRHSNDKAKRKLEESSSDLEMETEI